MRISIQKSTGRVVEMQSHATPGTLAKNAVAAGFKKADVEEREVTPEEYYALVEEQRPPAPEPTKAELLDQVQALLAKVEALS